MKNSSIPSLGCAAVAAVGRPRARANICPDQPAFRRTQATKNLAKAVTPMNEPALITEEYREMQQQLHQNPNYGVASIHFAPLVAQVINEIGAQELLDYGAGKGRLGQTLKQHVSRPLNIRHYDPAIPEWSAKAEPSGLVACIDVLEHIEPVLLDNVLDDLQRVTAGVGVYTVHTGAAVKVLPDGRNAHLIQQPPAWWLPRFLQRFELVRFDRMENGFWIIVERKQ